MTVPDRSGVHSAPELSPYTLSLNYVPFLFLVMGVIVTLLADTWTMRGAVALSWIYLVPPVICRVVLTILGRPQGRAIRQHERPYRVWWFLAQLQVPFNRLPALEAMLRLVPGLYAAWLNLWGAKVSPFAYWGPGSQILDRFLLRVERRAVIGTRVLMSGHLGVVAEDGEFAVDIWPVTIGEGAVLGAMAALGPGSRVAPAETVPAGRSLPPFSLWQDGRKVREGEVRTNEVSGGEAQAPGVPA